MYEKLYIPVVLRIDKRNVQGFDYIESISAGSSIAHILYGNNKYYMCLSKDDCVSIEERTGDPISYTGNMLDDVKKLADKFEKARKNEFAPFDVRRRRKWMKVIDPIPNDTSIVWEQRVKGYVLINTLNGSEVSLEQPKRKIMEQTGLTSHLITCIVKDGIEARNWCFKGKRLDNLSWEEYLKKYRLISSS